MNNPRTDVHRPSVIRPEEYEYVAFENLREAQQGDLGACQYVIEERNRIREHFKRTGGTYSDHEHGGNCHICGAWAIWTVLFWHRPTNTYIRTGTDCAALLEAGLEDRFRRWKTGVDAHLEAIAGKRKAERILTDAGLAEAWNIYEHQAPETFGEAEEGTVRDIVRKLVQYGSISEPQTRFLHVLLGKIRTRATRRAQWAAEKAAAADCPSGRHKVTGRVLKAEWRETNFGETFKAVVKSDPGYTVWVTAPSETKRGDRVEFTATITPSTDDPKFGFAKRPTGWTLLAAHPECAEAEPGVTETQPTPAGGTSQEGHSPSGLLALATLIQGRAA